MTNRTIKYKGIDINMSVDVEALRKNIVEPYEIENETLKAKVEKRDKYIFNMHKALRNQQNTMFVMYAAYQIYPATLKRMNLKRFLILSYLYDCDFAKPETITKFLRTTGNKQKCLVMDMKFLESIDYVKQAGKSLYYYITDDGKQKLEEIQKIFQSGMSYFLQNKELKKPKNVNKYGISRRNPTFTDEQKEQRRVAYRKLMKPFWDSNCRMIPKDKKKRIEVLSNWIELQKQEGKEVDEMYFMYMQKWL
jgi:hypothetical protein